MPTKSIQNEAAGKAKPHVGSQYSKAGSAATWKRARPAGRGGRRGWHVPDYDKGVEPRREGHPYLKRLDFIKEHIDLGSDEGASLQTQFMLLCNDGDGLKYCQYYGCYRLLLGLASRQARRYRGWLLGPGKEPLTDSQIGQLLHIPSKTMSKMLKDFARLKLIEKVEIPDFDSMKDEPLEDEGKRDPGAHAKRARAKSRARVRAPSRNDKTENGKNKSNTKKKSKPKDKQKATVGLAASGSKRKNNGSGKDDPQGKTNEQAPCPPTTPEPLPSMSRESDGRGDRVTSTLSPLPSLSNGQSSHGLSYGRRVYLGLGYRHDVDSAEARREITSFASKHDQVVFTLAALSPPAVDALLQRGLAEAIKIGKRKGNRNKGAVWHTVMDKLTAAAQQRRPPEKAAI